MPDWNAASYDEYQLDVEERHDSSRTRYPVLGIISFVLSLFLIAFLIVVVVLAMALADGNGKPPPDSPLTIVAGLGICATPLLAVLGLGLGIGSLFQRGSKLFGILGVVFNVALLFGTILLLAVGLLLGAAAVKQPPAGGGPQACGNRRHTFCARTVEPIIS